MPALGTKHSAASTDAISLRPVSDAEILGISCGYRWDSHLSRIYLSVLRHRSCYRTWESAIVLYVHACGSCKPTSDASPDYCPISTKYTFLATVHEPQTLKSRHIRPSSLGPSTFNHHPSSLSRCYSFVSASVMISSCSSTSAASLLPLSVSDGGVVPFSICSART